jgi:hypothetical protein
VTEIIVFPIPIRPDIVVQVQMPVDLTSAEGKRVARVVAAMATTETKSQSRG